jgi:hypothetical protein
MNKLKLHPTDKERLTDFLTKNTLAIRNAELQTYRETPVSTHGARVYIFTTHTMGIADLQIGSEEGIHRVIPQMLAEFKANERVTMTKQDDDTESVKHYMRLGGSKVTALLFFLPSMALKIQIDKVHELPQVLQDKFNNDTLSPSYIREDVELNKTYGHLVEDVLNVHYISYYADEGRIYKIVSHNDEVIDMPEFASFNAFGDSDDAKMDKRSQFAHLGRYIEVE